jgi:hypothetical protein
MQFIGNTTWQEIFEKWRSREANNPNWIECATKIKGWPNWEAWRSFTAQQIDAVNRKWEIYQFCNPLEEIPEMLIGPFWGWQSRVNNKNKTTFKELLEIPKQYEEWSKHPGISAIINELPFVTELIGLVRKDVDKIVCFEGHHRAVAVSLAKKQNKIIDFSKTPITIALTDLAADHCQLLDILLQRGTAKNPRS